jgi:dystonin
MDKELAANSSPAERKQIEDQLEDLTQRYDRLATGAQERMRNLEDALKAVKSFQDMYGPLGQWLDNVERQLRDMEIIPTDEDKIQAQIRKHGVITKENAY